MLNSEQHILDINDIQLSVHVTGPADGQPVWLLHGFPECWYSWRHQMQALADAGYRAFAPEMRGYGRSSAPAAIDAYDIPTICKDIQRAMDHFGHQQVAMVGHDWGANIAWYLALYEPERVKVVSGMSVPFGGRPKRPVIDMMRERFKDKFLYRPFLDGGGMGVLDPRFPEVRDYIVSACERAVRDWGFDGLKVDFVDWFMLDKDFPYAKIDGDPAERDGFRGRDIRSLPVAVDTLMKELVRRVRAVRPQALIEFRQHYMGPAIRQYGNMIRATDCPADSDKIRRLVADLRLTSGTTPVHSDMLVWSPDETPERAARPILNSIFSVIQYSMVLQRLPATHREVIRHWLAFTQEHRETLLKSAFRPHHPEQNYTWIEAESVRERIVAAYAEGLRTFVRAGKRQIVINATETPELVLDFATPAEIVVRDVFGRIVRRERLDKGLRAFSVPCSGLIEITPVASR